MFAQIEHKLVQEWQSAIRIAAVAFKHCARTTACSRSAMQAQNRRCGTSETSVVCFERMRICANGTGGAYFTSKFHSITATCKTRDVSAP